MSRCWNQKCEKTGRRLNTICHAGSKERVQRTTQTRRKKETADTNHTRRPGRTNSERDKRLGAYHEIGKRQRQMEKENQQNVESAPIGSLIE
jgi:hypothetical protein